ncbi:hypothetical protein LTR10_020535 [Elasticomyces elasticus]|uniref:SWR1-complex protein 3 domain-containing protein n=1 Tax=Exophiala sideris TaxID=1016849 RepID=A0ABR0J4Q1_9EURO|nr:hypothetical protein LTR10_020535 [Elasticomyces elasticus]KAK5027297.1 hypothetical protein LTS07_006898 [Exophiala sideris]KAK5035001.1 hypothetical protein LTR13_006184 [Exophiala sideris]KAK5056265.1 hypothetical protein LTR69_007805 [Exophiala sideris]KAK5181246.1 hypothetical protein LTR44_006578 [Eurotiomycetes sp. CCFEE 6388]
MADTAPPKRSLPARDRRESAAKRRASSPMQPPASTPSSRKPSTPAPSSEPRQKRKYTKRASLVRIQTPTSRSSPSLSVAEEVLPTRLTANKPLPTSKQKQPAGLSQAEYQSIAESAILAASLHRSRMQWLYDGIFEKYWVKPVKRKGVIEAPPDNPDVKSMQKLGTATITIEPHVFDAVFYTVRDPAALQPIPRHANQHTTKTMLPPRPTYGYPPPPGAYPISPAQRPPATPAPHSQGALPMTSPAPGAQVAPPPLIPAEQRPQTPLASTPAGSATGTPKQQTSSQTQPPATVAAEPTQTPIPPSKQANPPPGGKGSTTDPVIQMLAARAASDPQLKELMKVVATSRASPEQLKEFQAHIDEFNAVVRRQEAERLAKGESQVPVTTTPKPPAPTQPQNAQEAKSEAVPPKANPPVQAPKPSPVPAAAHPSTYNTPQAQPRPPSPPGSSTALPGVLHTFPPAPHAGGAPIGGFMGYHAPPPPPRAEPIIKHIVMEITSTPLSTQPACPDRWLFPEFAVLEIRFGGLEMLVSFLVERRGSQILSCMSGDSAERDANGNHNKWKPEQEYYEPVTMTVKATHHRTIETIARAARPLPVVQDHMKQVLGKAERAPKEYLVHQLPREIGSEGTEAFVDSGVELGNESPSEDDDLKDVYGI